MFEGLNWFPMLSWVIPFVLLPTALAECRSTPIDSKVLSALTRPHLLRFLVDSGSTVFYTFWSSGVNSFVSFFFLPSDAGDGFCFFPIDAGVVFCFENLL